MEGWSEKEFENKDLMAPCGLYCGLCGIYIATMDNNEKFKSVMSKLYGTKTEDTECNGCMQSDPPKNSCQSLFLNFDVMSYILKPS